MALVSKTFRFEAAHRLPNHAGKCRRLHGHSYKFTVAYEGDIQGQGAESRSSFGMVIDFGDISDVVRPFLNGRLDHWYLNHSLPEIPVTTAEMVAAWIFGACVQRGLGGNRLTIIIEETESSNAQIEYDDWLRLGSPQPDLTWAPDPTYVPEEEGSRRGVND